MSDDDGVHRPFHALGSPFPISRSLASTYLFTFSVCGLEWTGLDWTQRLNTNHPNKQKSVRATKASTRRASVRAQPGRRAIQVGI